MQKRKLLIFLLILDVLAIGLFFANSKYQIFKKTAEWVTSMVNKGHNTITLIPPVPKTTITSSNDETTQTTITTITTETDITKTETTNTTVTEDPYSYPILVIFDGMGGSLISGEENITLDGTDLKVSSITYPEYDYEEYEFIKWEKNEYTSLIDDTEVTVWEYYAVWDYSPIDYYFKFYVDKEFSFIDDSYKKTVENDIETIDLSSHIEYRSNYAVPKLYRDSSLTNEISLDSIPLNPGDNDLYLVLDAGSHGTRTYSFKIYRIMKFNVTFTVTGVLDTIEGIEDFIADEKETLSWIKDKCNAPGYTYTYSVTLDDEITSDINVIITVSYEEYTIEYVNTLDVDNPNPVTFNLSSSFDLAQISKEGYKFFGWFTDQELKNEITTVTGSTLSNLTIYAKLEPESYSITYDYEGGMPPSENPLSYTVLDTISLSTPTKPGYSFKHYKIYYTESDYDIYSGSFNYMGDIKVIAKYEESLSDLYYGKYPQEMVSDSTIINALNEVNPVNGIYKYDGEEYVKITAHPFISGLKFKDGTDVIDGKEYYFKVSPIEWIKMYDENNKYTLVSKYILDAHIFDSKTNDYSNSSLNKYLNSKYKSLFSDEESLSLLSITVSNGYSEANPLTMEESENWSYGDIENSFLYIPSYHEVHEYLESIEAILTDYAIAQGCYFNYETYNAFYFYRSPYMPNRPKLVTGFNGASLNDEGLRIDNTYGIRFVINVQSGDIIEEAIEENSEEVESE